MGKPREISPYHDIPHVVETLTRRWADGTIERYTEDPDLKCFSKYCNDVSGYELKRLNICAAPRSFNSGSHRVWFEATYNYQGQKEELIIAIEEIENWQCTYAGDAIYIGAGKELTAFLKSQDEDHILSVISFLIFRQTGVIVNIRENFKSYSSGGYGEPFEVERKRVIIHWEDPHSLKKQDCTLTEGAKHCFLYSFDEGFLEQLTFPSLLTLNPFPIISL